MILKQQIMSRLYGRPLYSVARVSDKKWRIPIRKMFATELQSIISNTYRDNLDNKTSSSVIITDWIPFFNDEYRVNNIIAKSNLSVIEGYCGVATSKIRALPEFSEEDCEKIHLIFEHIMGPCLLFETDDSLKKALNKVRDMDLHFTRLLMISLEGCVVEYPFMRPNWKYEEEPSEDIDFWKTEEEECCEGLTVS